MTGTGEHEEYELTLYVNGASAHAARAIGDAQSLCRTHLMGRHHLSVVDINADLAAFLRSGVTAAPALVRTRPLPQRLLIGDLSDGARVLRALDLPAGPVAPADGV